MIKNIQAGLYLLSVEPFKEGIDTFRSLGNCHGIYEKTVTLFKAALLVVPLINVIVSLATKRFAKKPLQLDRQPPRIKDPIPVKAAGVLPIRIHLGKIQYLLGKEAFGIHDKTWADFGGKKEGDENAIETAARECFEETCGLLGTQKTIEESLVLAPYIQSVYPKKDVIDYRLYFLFLEQTSHITDQKFSELKSKSAKWQEKAQIAWVDSEDLIEVICHIYLTRRKYQPIIIIDRHFEKLRHPFCRTLSLNGGKNLEMLVNYGQSLLATKAI